MKTCFKWLISFVFLFSPISSLLADHPFGGVLVLDGDDDYAVLPFEEHGLLIPKDTQEYTVEMWVYPITQPKQGEVHVMLNQQVLFESWSPQDWAAQPCREHDNQPCGRLSAILERPQDEVRAIAGGSNFLKTNQWNYIALMLKDRKPGVVFHESLRGTNAAGMDRVVSDEKFLKMIFGARPIDFFVGGFPEVVKQGGPVGPVKLTHFHGYIDAIRISTVARSDFALGVEQRFDPPHRFEADEHTLALWGFDDGEGATRFSDTSGNKKTLIGKNGAHVSVALAVNPSPFSIATTWGAMKSR